MPRDFQVVLQKLCRSQAPEVRHDCLAQKKYGEAHGHQAKGDHQQENRMPAKGRERQSSERRSHGRTDREEDPDGVENPGGIRAGVEVADDRASHNHANGGADALYQARGENELHAGGKRGRSEPAR